MYKILHYTRPRKHDQVEANQRLDPPNPNLGLSNGEALGDLPSLASRRVKSRESLVTMFSPTYYIAHSYVPTRP